MNSTGVNGPDRRSTETPSALAGSGTGEDMQVILSAELDIQDLNSSVAKVLQVPREELIGQNFSLYLANPEALYTLRDAVLAHRQNSVHLLELWSQSRCGIYLLSRVEALPGERILVIARDITSRRALAPDSPENRDRFRMAFEFACIGMALVDLDGNIFEVNGPLATLLGFSKIELKSMNLLDIWIPEEREEALAEWKQAGEGTSAEFVYERRYLNKASEILFSEVTRGLVRGSAGEPLYFVVSFRDITESKRFQNLLEERALTDPLTGALNRSGFGQRARFELVRSDRYEYRLAMLMIDLDHFKAVNDTYGHNAGDRVLRGFCDIARSCLRSTDILGRWGGEEFVALLPETGIAGAQLIAERLRTTLEEFRFDKGIQVRASVGIARRREEEEFNSLIDRADAALYRAKETGRNRVVVDSTDLEREAAIVQELPQLVPLEWKADNQSGEEFLDKEHEESFRLANIIISATSQVGEAAGILPLVEHLIAHARQHFEHEDILLERTGYPRAAIHARIHRKLIEKGRILIGRFERGQESAAGLLDFLIHDLVTRHILVEDRKFFHWFQKSSGDSTH